MINRDQYPALKQITWELHCETLSEVEAYRYYEERLKNWFEEEDLEDQEKQLIAELVKKYGAGVPIY